MLLEASYLSRFFAKFVEIIAGGLATAMCAYLIAHLGGPLSATMPKPAAFSPGPTALETPKSAPAQPAPPVAAADEQQQPAPQPVTDAPPAQPARKATKASTASTAVPASKDIKTSTSGARSEKSVEALARAALANFDAERPAPANAPTRRVSTGTGSVAPAGVEVQQRPADVPPPRQAETPPPTAAVEAQPRRVVAIEPLPPNASSPSEIGAPQPEPPAVKVKGMFSVLERVPDLLRFGTPSLAGEAPRPPMPVGTAARE
jgi:hypothetical protein